MTPIERKIAALEERHASQADGTRRHSDSREHVIKEGGTRWGRLTYGESVFELPGNGGDPVQEMIRRGSRRGAEAGRPASRRG
jgi:hypothetical protein